MQYISCLDEMASHHTPQETVAQGGTGCASNCGSCSDRCVSNYADLWKSDPDSKEAEGWDPEEFELCRSKPVKSGPSEDR